MAVEGPSSEAQLYQARRKREAELPDIPLAFEYSTAFNNLLEILTRKIKHLRSFTWFFHMSFYEIIDKSNDVIINLKAKEKSFDKNLDKLKTFVNETIIPYLTKVDENLCIQLKLEIATWPAQDDLLSVNKQKLLALNNKLAQFEADLIKEKELTKRQAEELATMSSRLQELTLRQVGFAASIADDSAPEIIPMFVSRSASASPRNPLRNQQSNSANEKVML